MTTTCVLALVLLSLSAHVHSSDAAFDEEPPSATSCLVNVSAGRNVVDCICKQYKETKRIFNGKVECSRHKHRALVEVDPLYCLTYDHITKDLVAGRCILTSRIRREYIKERENVTANDFIKGGPTCGDHSGTLCGDCNGSSALAINSYSFECMPRSECRAINWLLYFVETLVPLTVFFCAVLVFKLRFTIGHVCVFVLFAQAVALPVNIISIHRDWELVLGYKPHDTEHSMLSRALSKAVLVLYGVWNLDILRGVFPNICTDHSVGILEVFALQYVTASFPLVLVAIAYVTIQLHARNFRPLVIIWKPFGKCLVPFRRRIETKLSVVDTFAYFILLSYTKFAHTSLVILSPTPLYNITGDVVGNVLLYDGSIRYFEPPHTYYAIAAIGVLIVFVVPPPLLLFLYPMKWFQRLLDDYRLRNNLLTAFTDAYQGCYKDGLSGTKDCRFFAGIFFVVRIIVLILYAFVTDYFLLYLLIHIILAIILALMVIFRPNREDFFNKQDMLLTALYILITAIAIHNQLLIAERKQKVTFQTFFYIMLMLPLLYMSGYLLVRSLNELYNKCCKRRNQLWLTRHQGIRRVLSTTGLMSTPVNDNDYGTLPDRLLRPEDYS